ncbi:MAG: polyphosphate polymerase domain-containing protein [Chitinophagales bacterium]|nr:polyphosphate polymerase domain-containing protein [Chitinophagales bacterium]MDW8394037.1 polyphosphate polymerase domain-containing protein [Chitinophagales bacterium]
MSIIAEERLIDAVRQQLEPYAMLSLTELGSLHMLNRFDEKYLFSFNQLMRCLPRLQAHYRVLQTGLQRSCRYDNLYYDTPELDCYVMHLTDRGQRFKVRFRRYENTGHCFLEVKKKSNKGHTYKLRLPADRMDVTLDNEQIGFLHRSGIAVARKLEPSLLVQFQRITLVCPDYTERITIDFGLGYSGNGHERPMSDLVIAEIKQEHHAYHSPFRSLMLRQRIFPTTFSKYCMGIVLTHPGIKHNRFKPRLLYIRKLLNGRFAHDAVA